MSANDYIKGSKMIVPKIGAYKDFYFPVTGKTPFATSNQNVIPQMKSSATDVNRYFAPYHNIRPRVDHQYWKDAMFEMEDPILPYRVKAQQIYNNTILNGQVITCMNKRKSLNLLKEYHVVSATGVPNDKATKAINKKWFREGMNYILEAPAFGYSHVSFGDLVNGEFPKLTVTRRGWISPDREILSLQPYLPAGIPFNDPSFKDEAGKSWFDFSLWIPTPSDIGISKCGYGYLYAVAMYEIVLRNIIGWNSDFIEVYGQPLRHAKTNKEQDSAEYSALEKQMQQMGSNAYLISDPADTVEFIESKGSSGTGWKSYENLEQRDMKFISKIILGHSSAIDETPGKLGASQGGGPDNASPGQQALNDTQSTDSKFLCETISDLWFPKLQKFGFPINAGDRFELKDDMEKQEVKETEDKNYLAAATWAKMFKDAGFKIPAEFMAEHTGIEDLEEAAPPPAPIVNPIGGIKPTNTDVAAKLKNIYKDKK